MTAVIRQLRMGAVLSSLAMIESMISSANPMPPQYWTQVPVTVMHQVAREV
jgi:hypothetical protein